MWADCAVTPLVPLVGPVGLRFGGDYASDDSLLSREGDSLRLFDDARGDWLGRPSLLADDLSARPNGTNPPFEGEEARPKPGKEPCILWRRRPSIVPNRLLRFSKRSQSVDAQFRKELEEGVSPERLLPS